MSEISQKSVSHNRKIMDNFPDSDYEPIKVTIGGVPIVQPIIGQTLDKTFFLVDILAKERV